MRHNKPKATFRKSSGKKWGPDPHTPLLKKNAKTKSSKRHIKTIKVKRFNRSKYKIHKLKTTGKKRKNKKH